MKCLNCEYFNAQNNNFCIKCGSKLEIPNIKNPSILYEMVLKIINSILSFIFFSSFTLGVSYLIAISLGLGNFNNYNSNLYNSIWHFNGLIFIVSLISFAAIITFNLIIGAIMLRKNKYVFYTGKYKKINKLTYIILSLFLGFLGVNRFVIGDYKGGIIRLILLFGIPFILTMFNFIINSEIIIIFSIICDFSLAFSDFVIGLSKNSDKNNMISI